MVIPGICSTCRGTRSWVPATSSNGYARKSQWFLRNLPMKKNHRFGGEKPGNPREIPGISTYFHSQKVLAEARRSRNIVAVDNLWRERNAHPSNTSEASWAVYNAVTYTCWILLIGLLWTKPLFHPTQQDHKAAEAWGIGNMPWSAWFAIDPTCAGTLGHILGPRLVALVASLGFTQLQLGWEPVKNCHLCNPFDYPILQDSGDTCGIWLPEVRPIWPTGTLRGHKRPGFCFPSVFFGWS